MELFINDRFRNRKIDFFNEFSLNLVHDSVGGTFGFSFYFDPNDSEHKELACVSHYHEVTVKHLGQDLLKGYLTSQNFVDSAVKELCSFGGYSLPGVFEDCEIPTSLYPLQSDGLNLIQIAEKLARPFNIKVVVDESVRVRASKVFAKSTATESQTIKDYLTEIAKQKDIVLSHDEQGRLLLTEAKTETKPIIYFDGRNGVVSSNNAMMSAVKMSLSFNGQGMHSDITTQRQSSIDGGNAGQSTIRNPYVIRPVFRPTVKTQTSGDDNDTSLANRRELGAELKNMTLTIELDRWDINGVIIKPNQIISVVNPNVYIYKETKWFIESVNFIGNQERNTCTLNCVIPEVYNKKTPISIFSGINLHA